MQHNCSRGHLQSEEQLSIGNYSSGGDQLNLRKRELVFGADFPARFASWVTSEVEEARPVGIVLSLGRDLSCHDRCMIVALTKGLIAGSHSPKHEVVAACCSHSSAHWTGGANPNTAPCRRWYASTRACAATPTTTYDSKRSDQLQLIDSLHTLQGRWDAARLSQV